MAFFKDEVKTDFTRQLGDPKLGLEEKQGEDSRPSLFIYTSFTLSDISMWFGLIPSHYQDHQS